MSEGTCSIDGCPKPVHIKKRGWCTKHYRRWLKYGDPLGCAWIEDEVARFWSNVDRGGDDDCWPWTWIISFYGYGVFTTHKRETGVAAKELRAHRWAYEAVVGPIADGLVIDHTCHNRDPDCRDGNACLHRRCVNPAHLEAVTSPVNTMRGKTPTAINAAKTHCDSGHEFTPENTYIRRRKGRHLGRDCRACNRDRAARNRAKRAGGAHRDRQPSAAA